MAGPVRIGHSPAMTTTPQPTGIAFSADAIAAGEQLFAGGWEFVLSAPKLSVLPPAGRPEVAFVGRSNVGKSSLINALVRHKGLARTSNTPGRTQELVYFTRPGTDLYLVDMPGYGYAEAPKEKVDAWSRLVRGFLRKRPSLKRVFMLIDSRRGVRSVDEEVMALLDEAAVSYQIVLTKADKVKPDELAATLAAAGEVASKHGAAFPGLLVTSSERGDGIAELRATIEIVRAL